MLNSISNKLDNLKFKYYGNYGGPNRGSGVPVDDLDRAFQRHDEGYSRKQKKTADKAFWTERILRGNQLANPWEAPATVGFAVKDMLGMSQDSTPSKPHYNPPPNKTVTKEQASRPNPPAGRTGSAIGNESHKIHGNHMRRARGAPKPPRQTKRRTASHRRPKGAAGKVYFTAPAAKGARITTKQAVVETSRKGSWVTHEEMIGSLASSSTQWNLGFSAIINPANADTFPWLAAQAASYQFYRFERLSFRFEPLKSTSSDGSVMMSVDYKCTDDAPESVQEQSQMLGTSTGSCWSKSTFHCSPIGLNIPVGKSTSPSGQAPDVTADGGQLFIASVGCQAGATLGYIWTSYKVFLYNAQKVTFDAGAISNRLINMTSPSPSNPWGSAINNKNTGLMDTSTLPRIVSLASHTYLVTLQIVGTAVAAVPNISPFNGAIITTLGAMFNATQTVATYVITFPKDSYLTVDMISLASTVTSTNMRFGRYDPSYGVKAHRPIRLGDSREFLEHLKAQEEKANPFLRIASKSATIVETDNGDQPDIDSAILVSEPRETKGGTAWSLL